jgi:hypothetical protein
MEAEAPFPQDLVVCIFTILLSFCSEGLFSLHFNPCGIYFFIFRSLGILVHMKICLVAPIYKIFSEHVKLQLNILVIVASRIGEILLSEYKEMP